jgi:hypothetical protein
MDGVVSNFPFQDFFDRYLADEIADSLFTMAWSSYYDIFRRLRSDPAHSETVGTLLIAC